MPADRDTPGPEPTPRPVDPIVRGVGDAAAHGYRALESVAAGLSASMRIRAADTGRPLRGARTRWEQRAPAAKRAPQRGPIVTEGADTGAAGRRPPAGGRNAKKAPPAWREPTAPYTAGSGSGELLGDIAHTLAELLEFAGEIAHDVADVALGATGHDREDDAGEGPAEIVIPVKAGESADAEFVFWNTGTTALRDVVVWVTQLVGPGGDPGEETLTFTPDRVAFVRAGEDVTVTVTATVPPDLAPGIYRSLVQAEPGGAYAIIELQVSGGA